MKILIVKPSSLGDVVHGLCVLKPLQDKFPDSQIHWVIAKGLEDIINDNTIVQHTWVIDKDKWKQLSKLKNTIHEIKSLSTALKTERFDVVIDLQGLLRSGIISKITGAPVRIGFANAREASTLFYTHKVKTKNDIHAVDRYLQLVQALGCNTENVSFPLPAIPPTPLTQHFTKGQYIVMVPGARWQSKRWPAWNFGRLAAMFNDKTIFVGSAAEQDIANEAMTYAHGNAVDLVGKTTLKELIKLIEGAKFMVTNDTGPMHIGAALGVPVFAIFGPTAAFKTGPYGQHSWVLTTNAKCSPCFLKTCHDLHCLRNLSFTHVYEIISSKGQYIHKINN
ncbi:MAG: lipopolysaccharide heptosyltransferase I [Candidatus Magnetoovum sp. WYHC-5]|nr:lipopolysaccharide heptosyltransferase I [Candidatus Magnetoovum sp. WYHC-5]